MQKGGIIKVGRNFHVSKLNQTMTDERRKIIMKRKTKKTVKAVLCRAVALLLSLLTVCSVAPLVFANEIYPEAYNITSGKVYTLQNVKTGKYLTFPGYFEFSSSSQANNVYQSTKVANAEYSYAVRITRNPNTGKYVLEPLIFEHFGGGRVSYSHSLVTFKQGNDTSEFIISYNSSFDAYELRAEGTKCLVAVGNANGNAYQSNSAAAGTVSLSSTPEMGYQMWRLESVDVNPHVFKEGKGNVTKKNLASGKEWIFQLSGRETIDGDVTVGENIRTLNGGLIDIVKDNDSNRFIIRMKDTDLPPNRPGDDYAAVQITVNRKSNGTSTDRTVVIQDSGGLNATACQTLPIFNYDYMNTVTVDPSASDFDRSYIITFASDVVNSEGKPVSIVDWTIDDASIVDIPQFNGEYLGGNNFTVIRANNVGYTYVNARDSENVTHRKLIEVRHQVGDAVIAADNVINVFELAQKSNPTINLEYNRTYLLKTGNNQVMYDSWNEYFQTDSVITHEASDYALLETRPITDDAEYPSASIVNNLPYYRDALTFGVNYKSYTIKFDLYKDPGLCIHNGIYWFENFVPTVDEINSFANKNGVLTPVLGNVEDTSHWEFEYDESRDGYIIISSKDNSKILQLPSDDVNSLNAEVELADYDTNNVLRNQVWYIIYDTTEQAYSIRNCATSLNQNLYLTLDDSGQSIKVCNKNEKSNWEIENAFSFSEWSYICNECIDNNISNCIHYEIGYWKNNPTVGLMIKHDKANIVLSEDIYTETINDCIAYYNDELGINISYTEDFNTADIKIYVTSKPDFSEISDIDELKDTLAGITVYTSTEKITELPCTEAGIGIGTVEVNCIDLTEIGIFVYSDVDLLNWTIYHEMGHALGIWGHTSNPAHLMYIAYNDNNMYTTQLTYTELNNLKSIYEVMR